MHHTALVRGANNRHMGEICVHRPCMRKVREAREVREVREVREGSGEEGTALCRHSE